MSQRDDNWPKHPDGRNKRMSEMTTAEREQVIRHAVTSLQPEFQAIGVKVSFAGTLRPGEMPPGAAPKTKH